MNNKNFSGKVAVISGSSRGIGKAVARELAGRGAYVVMNGRNQERLSGAVNEIRRIQKEAIGIDGDVSTREGGEWLIRETIRHFGKLDILVNNVGVSMRGRFADLDPDVFKTIVTENLMGAVCPSIPALPYLRASGGSLLFISSVAGIRGLPFVSAYSASKMALRALAETIRIEEEGNHLHVGLIYVGFTENEPGKVTLTADGSARLLEPRSGKGVAGIASVAAAIVRNIEKKRFITVLSPIGKALSLVQPLFPGLVERIILAHLGKFEQRSR